MSVDTQVRTRSPLLASPPPTVALEIAATHVTALGLSGSGGDTVIAGYAVEPLAPGVVVPSLNAANVTDEAALTATIKTALEKAGGRGKRVALVLPDTIDVIQVRWSVRPEVDLNTLVWTVED